MTKKFMDFNAMSINPDTKGGTWRYSSRESNTRGSSINNEKPLPNYLRASTSSCHDFCKYGRKHIEAEAKNFFILKSENKFSDREKPNEINNSIPEERRKKLTVELKSSSTINKQKSKTKKEFAPTSENEESQVISITAGDQKKKQVNELKTLSKSNSLSYKHKVGEQKNISQKNISQDNGIDSFQTFGITTSSPLEDATSCIEAELIKKTSLKNMTSKKISKTAGIGILLPLAPSNKSTVQRNEEEYLKSGKIMETLEKKMKSSKSSPSLKHVVNGNLSLKQKQYKFGKQTNFTKDQKFGKSEHDTQSNATMHSTDKFSQNGDLDSAEQSLEAQNVDSDSSKEPLLKSENRDLKSLQKKSLDIENSGGKGMLGHKLLEFENVDMNFLHGNFLNPEEIVFESLEREPANQKFIKSKNAIMDFQEEKLQKPDDVGLDSLELKQNDCNLFKQENSEMDFHEHKLKKTESIDHDFLELNFNDYQSSQSAEEEIEESSSVYSESTDLESEHEQKESNNTNENSNGGKRRARRNTVVHPQVELSTPHKLKFRRGKIIEPQPESSGLRRLRFRRRRPADSSVTVGPSERNNFQSSEKIAKGNDPNPNAAQSVMLKHQEQEKKDTQGLFNSVIEETASKLVECRKSKVKALVGAFETVISLQDSKPSSTA